MDNLTAWMAVVIALASLLFTIRRDARTEFKTALGEIQAELRRYAQALAAVREDHIRMNQRFTDHERRDAEVDADIKTMLAELRSDMKQYFATPEHEEDSPATRRDIRHLKGNIEQTFAALSARVKSLEEQ